MSSIRRKLTVNENDSKNTRMNIASAGVLGNWRPDELAHISRYDKIATLCIEEAKRLGRPIDTLEVGCGECWTLRNLYKAHVVKKSDIIKSYAGYDIDPACELENPFWSNAGGLLKESTWFKNFNGEIRIQDLTVNPNFDLETESIDFFWSTEVIEHMRPDFVPLWLNDAARCMRPDAIAYISTPNHDGSNAKLPKDHIYEWGFKELKTELERNFHIEAVTGTFIQLPNLRRAQLDHQEPMVDGIPARANRLFPYAWTSEQMVLLKERFGRHFLRMAAATPYPEYSNNCAWRLVKK
jgi:SAM-dependent methyltransferase